MEIIIAIDSFKGSLTTMQAGNTAAMGIHRVYPDAESNIRKAMQYKICIAFSG